MINRSKLFSALVALPYVGSLFGNEAKKQEEWAAGGVVPKDLKAPYLDQYSCILHSIVPTYKLEPGTYLLETKQLLPAARYKEYEDYLNSKAPEGVRFVLLPFELRPATSNFWYGPLQPRQFEFPMTAPSPWPSVKKDNDA
jgi:hypothetical protein